MPLLTLSVGAEKVIFSKVIITFTAEKRLLQQVVKTRMIIIVITNVGRYLSVA